MNSPRRVISGAMPFINASCVVYFNVALITAICEPTIHLIQKSTETNTNLYLYRFRSKLKICMLVISKDYDFHCNDSAASMALFSFGACYLVTDAALTRHLHQIRTADGAIAYAPS
jgi:hypothetical protein